MIAKFLDVLEDTVKNPTWRPAELQAIDAPPALDYRTPDYTANAAKYMGLYGAKRRAEAKYAEALERAEQARRMSPSYSRRHLPPPSRPRQRNRRPPA